LQGGADIRLVQAFLGHTSLDVTKVYLRMVLGRLAEDYLKAMPKIAGSPRPCSDGRGLPLNGDGGSP
jgi:hypothetical protein